MAACIEFVVDGRSYYVPEACIRKYPDSYFCAALNPHWHDQNDRKLYLNNRNSDLFQFVALYLQFGVLPRDKRGDCLIDRSLLPSLLEKADYFCLSPLVDEINELMVSDEPASNVGRLVVSSMCYSASNVSIGYDLSQVNDDWYKEQLNNVVDEEDDEEDDDDTDSNDEDDNESISYSDSDPDLRKSVNDGVKIVDKTRFSAHCFLSSYWFQKAVHHKPRVVYTYGYTMPFNLTIGTKSVHMMPYMDISEVKSFIQDSVNMFSNALKGHELVIYKDHVLDPSYHSCRLQSIHFDSSTETVTGHALLEEGREVVGYVLVNVPSKESHLIKGGNVILDTGEDLILNRSIVAFNKNVKYELKPVTKGSQLLLVFEIIREQSQADITKWYTCYNYYQDASRQPTSLALSRIRQYFVDYVSKYSIVGVYTTEDYVEKGFTVNNLIGCDKALYEYMIDRCPISLVYVVVTGCVQYDEDNDYQKYKSTVRLLNIKYDTRLQCHRGCGSIPFIGRKRVRKCHEIDSWKVKYSKNWKFITTAFIIGVPK